MAGPQGGPHAAPGAIAPARARNEVDAANRSTAAQGGVTPRRYENWGARSVECYEKLEQVGEGTYGQVRAR